MNCIGIHNHNRASFLILTSIFQTEARKSELETNLATNLRRRKQELDAVISSVDADSLVVDKELKAQELSDAKVLVDDATEQLRSGTFNHYCLLSICWSQNYSSMFN